MILFCFDIHYQLIVSEHWLAISFKSFNKKMIAFGPGEYISVFCIAALAFPAGKIMNACPGTDLMMVGSEIIPAAIIYVPVQVIGCKMLLLHPGFHADGIELHKQ